MAGQAFSGGEVFVGGKAVRLAPSDYKASGGEGSVWRKGNAAYKIWDKPAPDARARIAALSKVSHPGLAAPRWLVEDKAGSPIGCAFDWVDGDALAKACSNAWWKANGFDAKKALEVCRLGSEAMRGLHSNGILAVDPNEFNWILKGGSSPVMIDADSWTPRGFLPTAKSPSICSPWERGFSANTDAYSWAVVFFRLLFGIHPFAGRHPKWKGAGLAERMAAGASVLDKDVSMPGSVRPFDSAPKALVSWFADVFSGRVSGLPDGSLLLPVQRAQRARARSAAKAGSFESSFDCDVDLAWGFCGFAKLSDGRFADLETGWSGAVPDGLFGARVGGVGMVVGRGAGGFFGVAADGSGKRFQGMLMGDAAWPTPGGVTVVSGSTVGQARLTALGKVSVLTLAGARRVPDGGFAGFDGTGVLSIPGGRVFFVLPDPLGLVEAQGLRGDQIVDASFGGGVVMFLSKRSAGGLWRAFDPASGRVWGGWHEKPKSVEQGGVVWILADGELLARGFDGSAVHGSPDVKSAATEVFSVKGGVRVLEGRGLRKVF